MKIYIVFVVFKEKPVARKRKKKKKMGIVKKKWKITPEHTLHNPTATLLFIQGCNSLFKFYSNKPLLQTLKYEKGEKNI